MALTLHVSKNPAHHKRKVTPQDGTLLARLMKITCPQCQQQMKGVINNTNGMVYLRCTKQSCKGGCSLEKYL
ncbi:hypothetical protein NIES4101_62440 [Calothrix sp. NIES-4101]|nr:hypothetical protein NIES4101_62440 [Calothrix sp. NIES-4101]